MANPWGAGIYSYVFKLSSDPVIRTQITEWQPLAKRLGAGSAFLAAVVGAVGLFSWRRNRWPMLGEMLGLLIFTALAATSGRFLIWWSLFVPPVLGGLIEGREQTSTERTRFGPAVALLIVALLIVGLVRVAVIQPGSRLLSDAPVGIAAAAAEQVKPGDHVFDGAWASWLEHQAPAGLMLLDDRAEFFSADLWDESQMVSNAEPGWKEQLDRWQVRVVVASWLNQGPLIRALRATPGWQEVHTDANGAVFVRA
jgi:hypothetical protein